MLSTDSYKQSHYMQYPEGTEVVYSYLESRGGKFDETVFFGLQYFIKEYLEGIVVRPELIDEAEKLVNAHMGPGTFNREGWEYIQEEWEGRLPIVIKAIPEGSVIPTSNALMVVYNTDPKCYWLTNFLETLLLQVWYPITVATLSRECKKLISEHMKETTNYSNQVEFDTAMSFKLHDFGFRGVSSPESAGIGGLAHLVNFAGTDTLEALRIAQSAYRYEGAAGFSIPASEHSTITSWGRASERVAYNNMLDKYPKGGVACVSDSYDIEEAVEFHWASLKDQILARDGFLVIRPDSGDIKMTLNKVLHSLWKNFGGEVVNGYKVLPPQIRVIQGDGMNYESLKETLEYLTMLGFSTDNVAFGMGGALLQKVDRDTQKFAFKCSAIKVKGEWRDVQKSPTEFDANGDKHPSFKKSKAGRLALQLWEGRYKTVSVTEETAHTMLTTVFENGYLMRETTLDEVRTRAKVL